VASAIGISWEMACMARPNSVLLVKYQSDINTKAIIQNTATNVEDRVMPPIWICGNGRVVGKVKIWAT
jgi:hypothetical protein